MKILIGHTNMDLDCIGSLVLAQYIYPDHDIVMSSRIHPVARNLYNLYQPKLNFMSTSDLKGEEVEEIIIVDTRSMNRVKEYFDVIPDFSGTVKIFDHHPSDSSDIPGATLHNIDYGSNTTWFCIENMNRGISIDPDHATIALAGIFADTGNFTYDTVTTQDFEAASYLMGQGASLKVVRRLLRSLKDDHQISLFHDILNQLVYQDFHGHFIAFSYVVLEKQDGGLAAVVEKVFDVENTEAIFSVFTFKKDKRVLIIARSRKDTIPVNRLLEKFGGGGHTQAASALVRDRQGGAVFRELINHIHSSLIPAVTAEMLMTTDVHVIYENWSLMEASCFLEKINHSGAPVVNDDNDIVGFITLKNIMKGRKADQMHAPVRGYMNTNPVTCDASITVRDIENIFYEKNIGHLPVVEGSKITGIVTRSDYLRFIGQNKLNEFDN